MAVTNQKSDQLNRTAASPGDGSQISAGIQVMRFDFTQSGAGDIGSTITLGRLSGGRIKVLGRLSEVVVSAWGTSRTVAIGWAAGTDRVGVAFVASTAGILAASTTAAAGGTVSPTLSPEVETRDRLEIVATVAGGTIPDGATLSGYISYLPMT